MYVLFLNKVNTVSVMRSSPSNKKSMGCSVCCADSNRMNCELPLMDVRGGCRVMELCVVCDNIGSGSRVQVRLC